MFQAKRVYGQANISTGTHEWFFSAREGEVGPFHCEEEAVKAFNNYIKSNIENGCDGGRSSGKHTKFSLLPNDSLIVNLNPSNPALNKKHDDELTQAGKSSLDLSSQEVTESFQYLKEEWEKERTQLQATIDDLRKRLDLETSERRKLVELLIHKL